MVSRHFFKINLLFKTVLLLKQIIRSDHLGKQTNKHRETRLKIGGFAPMKTLWWLIHAKNCSQWLLYLINRQLIGLVAYYAWVRTKHFGCHSVCQSDCHNGNHFDVIKLEHRVLYSHYFFLIDGKSYFLTLYLESHPRYRKSRKLEKP